MEKTKKELVWEELKALKKGQRLNMVKMSKKINCSLAYISSLSRYAYESGFLEFDDSGNYSVKKIPKYATFREEVNKIYTNHRPRRETTGTRTRKPKVPRDFVVDEETVLAVVSTIIQKNRDLEEKLEKLKKYAKKVKAERDDLMEGIVDI